MNKSKSVLFSYFILRTDEYIEKIQTTALFTLTLVALIALGAFWEKQDINTTTKEQTLSLFVNHAVKHTDERKKLLFGIRQTTAVTTNIFIAKDGYNPLKSYHRNRLFHK